VYVENGIISMASQTWHSLFTYINVTHTHVYHLLHTLKVSIHFILRKKLTLRNDSNFYSTVSVAYLEQISIEIS